MKTLGQYAAYISLIITLIYLYVILKGLKSFNKFSLHDYTEEMWILYKKFVVTMATIMILSLVIIGGEFHFHLNFKEAFAILKELFNL